MSPAPIVSTTSPSATSPATTSRTRARSGTHSTGTPATLAALATALPVTPLIGASRAAKTPVTTTTSAAERVIPNSAANRLVREYRCGWNTATTRAFGNRCRAAPTVTATSVGWWA